MLARSCRGSPRVAKETAGMPTELPRQPGSGVAIGEETEYLPPLGALGQLVEGLPAKPPVGVGPGYVSQGRRGLGCEDGPKHGHSGGPNVLWAFPRTRPEVRHGLDTARHHESLHRLLSNLGRGVASRPGQLVEDL